jgi:hypothetical protein
MGKWALNGEHQKKGWEEKKRPKERKNKKNTKQEEAEKCRRTTGVVYWSQIFHWIIWLFESF